MSPSTQHRLRKHADFQRVYKSGSKKWAQQLAYFTMLREIGSQAADRSETDGPRVGLTVPKALGKAVDRNRIKRRLRALVRTSLPLLGDLPVDLVLHPKRSVMTCEFAALEREIAQIFRGVRVRPPSASSPRGRPAHAASESTLADRNTPQ